MSNNIYKKCINAMNKIYSKKEIEKIANHAINTQIVKNIMINNSENKKEV